LQRSESQRQSPLETPYEYGTSQYESVIHPPTAIMAPTGPRSTVPDEDDAMADVMESLVNVDPSLVEVHDTIASGEKCVFKKFFFPKKKKNLFFQKKKNLFFQKKRKNLFSGTFSLIQRGFLTVEYPDTGETVAREVRIKTVKPGASYVQKTIMFEDGLILYGMQHPNINSLIGCVFGPSVELPMLLYNGGNYSNLRDLLASANRTHFLPLTELVYLSLQALDGIRYLHSCGVIHKDIAARNCL
jgi:serine/threonine protein kinase